MAVTSRGMPITGPTNDGDDRGRIASPLITNFRAIVEDKLRRHWSPRQVSRWLRRRWPRQTDWHLCVETIYDSVNRGLVSVTHDTLRTGGTYRHKRGRGRTKEGALKQLAAIRSIHDRPAIVQRRLSRLDSRSVTWKVT